MMKMLRILLPLLVVVPLIAQQKTDTSLPTVQAKTAGCEKLPGYFPMYWSSKEGKLWIEISRLDSEFLYVNSLATGVGSNDIGLDRGQLGDGRIVKFERVGPRVLLLEPNYGYRAITPDQPERQAVEESFAQSVLWGFDIAAASDTSVLIDATPFFLRDAHNIAGTLKRANQGIFKIDPSRCAIYLPRTKNFPLNTEVEATITYTGDEPGNFVQQVTPTPQAITVRLHHSFVKLPDPSYTPRKYDPRAGFGMLSYYDYATPISEPVVQRFIIRHRLRKLHPEAAMSEPVKPIVYYIDRGAPEPVRSALLEGASWWNQACEAAGYKNAFRVELLPEGADPMDLRYNVVEWVHRSTRGWSYGGSIIDPRTGEILKGHVTLGSLRIRQDYLIAQGLVGEFDEGKPVDPAPQSMALARIRQLAAHEVGHTLGLMHNYIASTANRASVMDYPPPHVTIKNDSTLDLSNAYATGIGEWDKVTIAYGYQDFVPGSDERKTLDGIIRDAAKRGLIFLTDQDARPPGSAHPQTHLWDNGTNAVDELGRVMAVRSIALRNFSEKKIPPGTPLALLEDVLVPVYMGHRYQLEAAAKTVGGLSYTYALRGDGQVPTTMVPPAEQRRALSALLDALKPDRLAIPENIISMIPPRPAGYERDREDFRIRTGLTFDPISPGETLANLVLGLLLNPARAARLVEYHDRNASYPGLHEVVGTILQKTWYSPHAKGYYGELQRTVDQTALDQLILLAQDGTAATAVRAGALLGISNLKDWLGKQVKLAKEDDLRAHYLFALSQIRTFEEHPKELNLTKPVDPPDGPPIGSDDCDSY